MSSDGMPPGERAFPPQLITAFGQVARRMYASEDFGETVQRITAAAVDALPHCDAASLTLLEGRRLVSHGATDPLAEAADTVQYEEREGPCLDAAMAERWLYTADLAADPRWPRSSKRLVEELGVESMLSCRLSLNAHPERTVGGINFYARTRDAYTVEDRTLALMLASLAAVAVDASRHQAQLRAAIQSRQTIGEAIGMIRAESGASRDDAFAMLSSASQRLNVKLRDLASEVTEGTRRTGADT